MSQKYKRGPADEEEVAMAHNKMAKRKIKVQRREKLQWE
jgi:hypothetical protein